MATVGTPWVNWFMPVTLVTVTPPPRRPATRGRYGLQTTLTVPTIRSFGFRKAGSRPVPLIHAKMFLLGHLWWHDEGAFGPADVTGFTPKGLWMVITPAVGGQTRFADTTRAYADLPAARKMTRVGRLGCRAQACTGEAERLV
ncbi:hypothetical protein [Streptomyces wuyuanensis]|uniref:hypothetical protein n=1 Tax=Streptomyces wuyuanensis TaxID=1196353 RepID=UPI00343D733E